MLQTATTATTATFRPQRIETLPTRISLPSAPAAATPLNEELLPFTVKVVSSQAQLAKAVQIRHDAYARHLPEFAETLLKPEAADFEKGVVVLVAESKEDGSPVGTIRIQTNAYKPLTLEQSIALPDWLKVLPMAEATRLGVTNEKGGRLVTTALFKAYYMYCKQIGIEWMVIAGRSPIDRQYQRMLFDDVFPGRGFIPLAHASNLPHRVMSSCVKTAEERWTAVGHPLFDFAFRTHHPDIMLETPRRPLSVPSLVPSLPSMGATLPIQPAFPAAGSIYTM
jgi:hypothetical protein